MLVDAEILFLFLGEVMGPLLITSFSQSLFHYICLYTFSVLSPPPVFSALEILLVGLRISKVF